MIPDLALPNVVSARGSAESWRLRRMSVVSCFGMLLACGSAQRPPAQSADPLTSSEPRAAAPNPSAAAPTAPSPRQTAPELQRLVRSVRALEDGAEDPAHYRLTRSLRDAADALDEIEADVATGEPALRTAAARIEASSADSHHHADELRTALLAARGRLRAYDPGAQRTEAVATALAELDRAVDTLNTSRPLLEQRSVVSSCFRALADAVFLAAGHEAPFAGRVPEPRSVVVMEQARADVLALGRADLSNIRELTARAMYAMAELVEAVAGRDVAALQIAEMRAEARRLQHDSSGPFARTGWVERGLQTALGVLDELELCRERLIAEWAEAARFAATTLPERGALPFQHGAMQDAFRATLDAFGAAVFDRETCPAANGGPRRASAPAERAPTR